MGSIKEMNDDKTLNVDIEIISTPCGQSLKDLFNLMELVPAGTGKLDKNGVVSDYTLDGFNFVTKKKV